MSDIRVARRGRKWGVQERKRWLWRWIGPFGDPRLGVWDRSAGALDFANFCERYDREREARS